MSAAQLPRAFKCRSRTRDKEMRAGSTRRLALRLRFQKWIDGIFFSFIEYIRKYTYVFKTDSAAVALSKMDRWDFL